MNLDQQIRLINVISYNTYVYLTLNSVLFLFSQYFNKLLH